MDVIKELALAQITGVNTFYKIAVKGLICDAFDMQPEELAKTTGIKQSSANRITKFSNWQAIEDQLNIAQKEGIRILRWNEEEHPFRMFGESFWPPVIYIKGNINTSLFGRGVAVVGTRKADSYASGIAYSIGEMAARAGIVLVSGMALGVDAEAHRGSLDAGGITWAVLGSGADQPYPQQNLGLYKKILDHGGAIISFYPPGTPPLPENFPRRNELIALLASRVVVVAAPKKSGALYTAKWAEKYSRRLYVVPGPIDKPIFSGSNALIKCGKARAAWSIDDIFEDMDNFVSAIGNKPASPSQESQPEEHFAEVLPLFANDNETQSKHTKQQKEYSPELSETAQEILNEIPPKPVHLDIIAQKTKIPQNELISVLMELVFSGAVEELPGRLYRRKS